MRADRLVAILLMLQARGQVTAAQVADELEVSERTARRDLEALGMAGLPIYSQQGRGGGWQLAGGGKTDLSGLTASEARALFLVAGPASATPQVRAALRKLMRALPESFRPEAEAASAALVIDPAGWDRPSTSPPTPPFLDAIQDAVVAARQVELGYVGRTREPSLRVVHPLGLAAKGRNWYLVAGTEAGLRTFRVDRVTSLRVTGETVVRPEGFRLADAWRMITDEVDQRRTPVRAHALLRREVVWMVRGSFGTRAKIGGSRDDGRVEAELRSQSEWSLAGEVARFGDGIEIIEPAGVRARLAEIGEILSRLYRADLPDGG